MIFNREENRRLREELKEKNRKLQTIRQRMAGKDNEIQTLRSRLERVQSGDDSRNRPDQDAPVFFLVGRAKSGTSWLMRSLNSHPEILCRGEGRLFGREYRDEDIKQMDSKTIQPSSLYRAILDAEYLNAWIERSVWTRDEDKETHLNNLTRVAVEYFMTQKLARTSKRIVGDKTPFLGYEMLKEIGTIYPEAKTIHIIRDGRDVAISSIHHVWNHPKSEGGTYDLGHEELDKRDRYRTDPRTFLEGGESIFTDGQLAYIARDWKQMVDRARQDGPELLGENYAEVRYEDLLSRPEEELERLLRLLGTDASEEAVKACVEAGSFERWSKGRERGQEDSAAFLRKGVAGDWENVFTEQDKRAFREAAGETLVELGYEKDNDW